MGHHVILYADQMVACIDPQIWISLYIAAAFVDRVHILHPEHEQHHDLTPATGRLQGVNSC